MSGQAIDAESLPEAAGYLQGLVDAHPVSLHPLFLRLKEGTLTRPQAVRLLVNYDAHAGLLRRLLLTAAAAMPEAAVGFILENVRNEYGNGNYTLCHENLLHDLLDLVADGSEPAQLDMSSVELRLRKKTGSPERQFPLEDGVREYISKIAFLYSPGKNSADAELGLYKPAITAGAITATEIMALLEFQAMQEAFRSFDLALHPWFDHVNVESEHSEESLALAGYFIVNHQANDAVEFGLKSTLDLNASLYDGLLSAISQESGCVALQPG